MGVCLQTQGTAPPEETHPIIKCIIDNNSSELTELLEDNNINGAGALSYPEAEMGQALSTVPPEETHPIIKCIIDNNSSELKNLLEDNNVNGVYPCRESADHITPLIAAVSNDKRNICAYLLQKGANPNMSSRNGLMPLHNASVKSVPSDFVKILLEANADPNRWEEVFETFDRHMLLEDPQTHLIMIEVLFTVIGPGKERYCLESIKWLRDTGNLNTYIGGVVSRLPKVSKLVVKMAIDSLHAVFCTTEEIPDSQAQHVIHKLLDQLHAEATPDLLEAVLKTLYVITRKSKGINGWDHNFTEKLCHTIAPFVEDKHSFDIRVFTYGVFANFQSVEHVASTFTSVGITSVPEDILISADLRGDLNEVLRQLSEHFSKPNLESANDSATAPPSENHRRLLSIRWKEQLDKLRSKNPREVIRIGSMIYVDDEEFRIENGNNGTQVFLGLRDDGTEVAIKRMTKSNLDMLTKEKEFLQYPELDHPSIVRYVYQTQDKNFGYLVLQLCEYTLKEFLEEQKLDDDKRKKLVEQVLQGLKVLHCQSCPILHRDLKPQNVLIDVTGRARLADFGISRWLPEDKTTLLSGQAGTRCWMARETLVEKPKVPYKKSSDIQVAGMLIYYILSGGKHPFDVECEKSFDCEKNIDEGKYSLDEVQDLVAKDLIEMMIRKEATERANVEECLGHPFFWTPARKVEYLRRIANRREVAKYEDADPQLISSLKYGAGDGSWKDKFPSDLVKKMEGKKPYPETTMGLLRFYRNLQEHYLFFDLDGKAHLILASRSQVPVIYQWSQSNQKFVLQGEIPNMVDVVAVKHFRIKKELYLAMTCYIGDSKVLRWGAKQFAEIQALPSRGSIILQPFFFKDHYYLALGSDYTFSHIYLWDDNKKLFDRFKEVYIQAPRSFTVVSTDRRDFIFTSSFKGNTQIFEHIIIDLSL